MDTRVSELVKNQIPDVCDEHRLRLSDMERIAKNIDSSLFNPLCCCNWLSYVSNRRRPERGITVKFFFRGSKVQLHRLLYQNYVSDINYQWYIKRNCCNCDCVSVCHMYRVKYLSKQPPPEKETKERRLASGDERSDSETVKSSNTTQKTPKLKNKNDCPRGSNPPYCVPPNWSVSFV